eukprot:11174903-Lingulodinium_polyedra.AAC.1
MYHTIWFRAIRLRSCPNSVEVQTAARAALRHGLRPPCKGSRHHAHYVGLGSLSIDRFKAKSGRTEFRLVRMDFFRP